MPETPEAREAAYGKRMIEIKIRFWTDSIAERKGHVIPKHAWDAGVVRVERNSEHGLSPRPPVPFNSLAELPSKIEKVLTEHGIVLHLGNRSRKYLSK